MGDPPPAQPAAPRNLEPVPASQQADSDEEFGNFSGPAEEADQTAWGLSTTAIDAADEDYRATDPSLDQSRESGSHKPQQAIDWSTTRLRPHTVQAAFGQPKKANQSPTYAPNRQHTVGTAFSPPQKAAESEEEDEFGDFENVKEPAAYPTYASQPQRY